MPRNCVHTCARVPVQLSTQALITKVVLVCSPAHVCIHTLPQCSVWPKHGELPPLGLLQLLQILLQFAEGLLP
jgi:hypothetical protein